MAYLDLSDLQSAPRARWARVPLFDRTAEAALELARHDGIGTLRRPGRLRQAVERLLGLHATPPLADPRLEALRRLGVAARSGKDRLVAREATAAREAGFAATQLDAVFARFGFTPAFERA